MPPWLKAVALDALKGGDLAGACDRAGVTVHDVHLARQRSPEADAAMAEVDQAVRLSARAAVEALAARGDLKAIRAMTDGTLNRLDGRDEPGEAIPAHVADAMLAAGLAALQLEEPPADELGRLCPACGGFTGTPGVVYYPAAQRADPIAARTAKPPSLRPGQLGST